MEGPSLFLAQQQLQPFKKQPTLKVSGNTKTEKERLQGKIVTDIFSWGKHLVFQYDDFAVRIHFLLFGTFEADVEGVSVTGEYRRAREARLSLTFPNGQLRMYNCSVQFIESSRAKKSYDFTVDIMSPKWDEAATRRRVREQPSEEIGDMLLDQTIFAGVGNIIKNEVLSLTRVQPRHTVGDLSNAKIAEVVRTARSFSKQFYRWRKKFVLRKHLLVHGRGTCPHCGGKLIREKTGKRIRWSYWCQRCQR